MHGKKENPVQVKQENPAETTQDNLTQDVKVEQHEKDLHQASNLNENKVLDMDVLEDEIPSGYVHSSFREEREAAATSELEWDSTGMNQIAEEMNEAILNSDYAYEKEIIQGEILEDTPVLDTDQQIENLEEIQSSSLNHQTIEEDEQAEPDRPEINPEFQQEKEALDFVLQPSDSEEYEVIEETDSVIEDAELILVDNDEHQTKDISAFSSEVDTYKAEDDDRYDSKDDYGQSRENGQVAIPSDITDKEDIIAENPKDTIITKENMGLSEEYSMEDSDSLEDSDQPIAQIGHTDMEVSLAEKPNLNVEKEPDNVMDEEERRKLEREKRIKERRKHIPFNVLMLKNDKDHLAAHHHPKTNGEKEEAASEQPKKKLIDSYQYPDIEILNPRVDIKEDADWLAEQAALLDDTLEQFNVKARVHTYSQGPSVTRFEVQPEPGVKVSKITNLNDDLKLSLAAKDIRIEAPIPGKRMIGIEIPNINTRPVYLREVLEEEVFVENSSPLSVAVGLDISGNAIVTDLKKMPHGLVAGSTGSGKSVFINSVLISLLYKSHPSDVRVLLIDPKMVELAPYNNIPHLAAPVITDVKAATAALKWAVEEMERRYELFAHSGARDIVRYNEKALSSGQMEHKLPYLVIVIDELADLMMMSPADVEEAICRIAQKARACGIHLLVATQRPSVDVITGLIKANIPTRIAFSVSSQVDSRTILDQSGAEKLLGRGDMLFLENGTSKAVRLQGTFVTDDEIEDVVKHVRNQAKPSFMFEPNELVKTSEHIEEKDELYYEVCEFAVEMGGASISSLQRRFRIGYNRAARLIDILEREGILSESKGSKPRDVLISESDLEAMHESHSSF